MMLHINTTRDIHNVYRAACQVLITRTCTQALQICESSYGCLPVAVLARPAVQSTAGDSSNSQVQQIGCEHRLQVACDGSELPSQSHGEKNRAPAAREFYALHKNC